MMKRPPDFVVGDESDPYLRRWWLIPRNARFNVYLHHFCRSDDDRALHDHPWWNCSVLLRGRYREHLPGGRSKIRKPWRPWAPWRLTFRSDRAATVSAEGASEAAMASIRTEIEVDLDMFSDAELVAELEDRNRAGAIPRTRASIRRDLLEAFREGDAAHFEIVLNRHLGD